MSWDERCSRCGDERDEDRDGELCEGCEQLLERRARAEGVHCPSCNGQGEFIDCFDDLCHWKGRCFHTGNTVCNLCDGTGRVSPATRDRYWQERYAEQPAQLTPLQTIGLLAIVAVVLWLLLAVYGVTLT